MKNFVNEWIIYSGTLILLLSFILAFQLRKNKNAPRYFKFFYWIPLLRVIRSVLGILFYFRIFSNSNTAIFQNTSSILEFCIITVFFFRLYKKKSPQNFVVALFIISIILAGYLLSSNRFDYPIFHLYAFLNFPIFLFCLHYYRQLLKNYGVVDLSKDPTFWIVLGLFIFSTVNLPLYAIEGFIQINYGSKAASYIIKAFNIIVIVEHLLFIKAYRCAPHFSAEPSAEADDFPPLDIN